MRRQASIALNNARKEQRLQRPPEDVKTRFPNSLVRWWVAGGRPVPARQSLEAGHGCYLHVLFGPPPVQHSASFYRWTVSVWSCCRSPRGAQHLQLCHCLYTTRTLLLHPSGIFSLSKILLNNPLRNSTATSETSGQSAFLLFILFNALLASSALGSLSFVSFHLSLPPCCPSQRTSPPKPLVWPLLPP